ncbi:MAG TPA: TIR domain-containing protein [Candidatus Levilactobacillus faecigallinarum]|uniref:TIR domain-containing protein n=1 Tax=Candidatus Levilactobacillus faecigallinarum TaxID=2838638 RepID=A0A9D1QSU5_9LACO|nr:TIR domain-containing protein [Candidatus Levilactobacillus faecigallinarum]
MSTLLISYQANDPLAQSFQHQLQEWADENWDFPTVKFHQQRTKTSFTGWQAMEQRRKFRQEIKQVQQFLVIISRDTWQSEWVNWEIETAAKQDKWLYAAKLDIPYMIPISLWEAHPQWIEPFDQQALSQGHI